MTQLTPQPVSEHAPPQRADPLHIAGITVKAVDQIGESAAAEIGEAAATIRSGAELVAKNLDQLADAIRRHTVVANGHVQKFLDHAEQVLTTVRALQVPEVPDVSAPATGRNGHEE